MFSEKYILWWQKFQQFTMETDSQFEQKASCYIGT